MTNKDPLAVIETETPQFSNDDAVDIAKSRYGLSVSVKQLVSERDQNFQMQDADGRQFVLKIANTMEDPVVTDFQIDALLYLQSRDPACSFSLNAPEILLTTEGKSSVRLHSSTGQHVGRVVTYVDGTPLGDSVPSPELCTNMGRYLAHLGLALQGFEHPGSSPSLLWDMQQALRLRELLQHIDAASLRDAVETTLAEFERNAISRFPQLRSQVIHSDFNPDNVLLHTNDSNRVAGVIDFGDMVRAPLVVDAAIAASYLRIGSGNPLALVSSFLFGYHSVLPLTDEELEIFLTLVKTRLAATVCILYWRKVHRGNDDAYLAQHSNGESAAGRFLMRLAEMPLDAAAQTFRQVCAAAELENG